MPRPGSRRLGSSDPRQVAWGAFRAAEYRIVESVPDLLKVLEAPPYGVRWDQEAMIAAVLDAAVQLDARLPAGVLRSYYERWPTQTLILLGQATDGVPVLVDLLRTARGYRWYTLANLALQARAPGFAAELLSKVQFTLRVRVVIEDRGSGIGGGSFSGGVGDGIGVNPAGFPPNAFYRFEGSAGRGFVVLASGPRPVYYSRAIYYQPQFPTSYTEISGPTSSERIDYVSWLLSFQGSGRPGLRTEQTHSIQWGGPDDFVRRVSGFHDELVRSYERLVSALLRAGQLTGTEAEAIRTPRVELSVVDERLDRSQPLPAIPALR
jgi:hypothetical protein